MRTKILSERAENQKSRKNESGQAITEYITVAGLIVVGLALAVTGFLILAGEFYQNVTRVSAIPFP